MQQIFRINIRVFILPFLVCVFIPKQLMADKWRFLNEEHEALQCRFDLIQQAEKEILLSTFIFEDDLVGNAILHHLSEAAKERGVIVKIMVDGHNYKIDKKTRAYLSSLGIQLRKFRVKKLQRLGWFRGLHEKILIIDGKWLITGGRNVQDKYFGLNEKFNFKDLDVLIESSEACKDARFHFFESWHNSNVSSPLNFSQSHIKKKGSVPNTLLSAMIKTSSSFEKVHRSRSYWLEGAIQTEKPITFIHDDLFELKNSLYVRSDFKDSKCTDELIALMSTAQSQILIENPYFIPTPEWELFFEEAQKKGIKIKVLVNSIETNDMVFYQAAYLNRRERLVNLGLEIWEYHGTKKMHQKTILIDGEISIIGSYNIHYPSEVLNTEVVVVVKDENVAQYHLELIEHNFSKAVRIKKDNIVEIPPNFQISKPSFQRKISTFLARNTISHWFNRYL